MLYDLDGFKNAVARPTTPDDITMVVGVRLHAENPWVLERVALLKEYYEPAPTILVVDLGSADPFADRLASACAASGLSYLRCDDDGTYSQARARNFGALHARTQLLFFNDIDCLGKRDLFAGLADLATAMGMGGRFDEMINLPVYHLSANTTAATLSGGTAPRVASAIAKAFASAAYSPRGEQTVFTAPYSNLFLCHRAFFNMTGGYNESFRGHGSEDFEYLLRFAKISGQFPMPKAVATDRYGPITGEFYEDRKTYQGYRRLFELMSFQAETSGLRMAHLHHEKPTQDRWIANRDSDGARFRANVKPILQSDRALLDCDWLPRKHKALALILGDVDIERLLVLRLSGYRISAVGVDELRDAGAATEILLHHAPDALVVFGEDGDSTPAAKIVAEADDRGLEVINVTEGDVPESYCYRSNRHRDGERDGERVAQIPSSLEQALARELSEELTGTGREYDPDDASTILRENSFFRDGKCYWFRFDGSFSTERASISCPVAPDSYAAGRLSLGLPGVVVRRDPEHGTSLTRLVRKFRKNPHLFLADSRLAPLRWLAHHVVR